MVYATTALVAGFLLPRAERAYFPSYLNDVSVNAALAFLGAIASGMMALTAIVFSIAFVTVQFNAVAYSPRLALWFANEPRTFHSMGVFIATFIYALWTMAWVDRGGGGGVPLISGGVVLTLLVASTYSFTVLVSGLTKMQIANTLHQIGNKGREVIAEIYPRIDDRPDTGRENQINVAEQTSIGPISQTLKYFGRPRTIAKYDIGGLVQKAEQAGAVFELANAVGDTIVFDSVLLTVHGAKAPLEEAELLELIDLQDTRTFEQDPKYAVRLLVDIAIKALSPAINDPTTAVQAIDLIEDILRRLARHELDTGYTKDANGILRLIVPMPTWEDYLHLAFDEIRQYGGTSVQVMRRLRSALVGLAEVVVSESRTASAQKYLERLDLGIARSTLDAEDQQVASQEDRQGLGVSRKKAAVKPSPAVAKAPIPQRAGE